MRLKTCNPCLEALEDRLTPSLTYVLDAVGDLSVTGSTANATVTISSTAAGVTVKDGASSRLFAVTANLSINIQMTNAAPTLNYDPGVNTAGSVSLTATNIKAITVNVAGTTSVNVNGLLSITTGAGNDSVNVDNVNPAGLNINTGSGQDTVKVGFNNPVTVRGNLQASNVNLIGLGVLNGPAVTVQGLVSASTDVAPGITFGTPNNIDVENNTTIQGNLIATLNGAFELFSTMGAVQGGAYVSLGSGQDEALFQDGSSVGGSVSVTASTGASSQVGVSATIGGNLSVILGNGGNQFAFSGTLGGTSINYHGGNGNDSVTINPSAFAPGAHLQAIFGAGDDTFNLNGNVFASAYIDGGFGTNTFNDTVPINFPSTILNF